MTTARSAIWPMQHVNPRLDTWARPLLVGLARLWQCRELVSVSCVVNDRLSTCLGRCRPAGSVVELSPRLFGREWRLRGEVLCHEAAHIAVRTLRGSSASPHGREWQALMQRAGFRPRAKVPTSRVAARKSTPGRPPAPGAPPRFLYQHRCAVCQFTRVARRAVPHWRCAACVAAGLDGALIITRLRGD